MEYNKPDGTRRIQRSPALEETTDNRDEPPTKRLKVTSACELCRKKKIKCDGSPPCDPCIKAGTTCIFDKPPKKRGPQKGRPLQSPGTNSAGPSSTDTSVHQRSISESSTQRQRDQRYGYGYNPSHPSHPLSPKLQPPQPVSYYHEYYQREYQFRSNSPYQYIHQPYPGSYREGPGQGQVQVQPGQVGPSAQRSQTQSPPQGYLYNGYHEQRYPYSDRMTSPLNNGTMMPPPPPPIQRLPARRTVSDFPRNVPDLGRNNSDLTLPLPTGVVGQKSVTSPKHVQAAPTTPTPSSQDNPVTVLTPTTDGLALSSITKDFDSVSKMVWSWVQSHGDEPLVEAIQKVQAEMTPEPGTKDVLSRETMQKVISNLPDSIRDILIDEYFSVQRMTHCPILNEVIFRARVGSKNIPAPITFFAAMAIGAHASKSEKVVEHFRKQLPSSLDPSKEAGKYFFVRAKQIFLKSMDKPPFCTGYLQGCLILTLYLRLWLCLETSWIFLRHALSVCQMLGYTRDSGISRFEPIWKQEEKRRCTWIALGLDCSAVLSIDKEPTMEYDGVTCKVPSREDGDSDEVDFLKTNTTSIVSVSVSSTMSTGDSGLIGLRNCHKRILLGGRIARRIRNAVDTNGMEVDVFHDAQAHVDSFKQLENLKESIESISRDTLTEHIFYDGIVIALHRIFLPNIKNGKEQRTHEQDGKTRTYEQDCRNRCTRSARRITALMEKFVHQDKADTDSVFVSTDYIHFPALYAAVTIHLYDATAPVSSRSPGFQSDAKEYLLKSLRLLHRAKSLTMVDTPELIDEV